VGLAIGANDRAAAILALVAELRVERTPAILAAPPTAAAAIALAKLARYLPALLVADGAAIAAAASEPPLVMVSADAVAEFRQQAVASLAAAAEANVPLDGGLPARFVIFRDAIGGTSVAAIVGAPDFSRPVASMLQMLGCREVLLLTNNPAKLDGLSRAGIEVSGRIRLQVPSNPDNRRYLAAKAARAGHQLDPVVAVAADGEPIGGETA
jgi:hypothetical protein